MDLGVKDFAVTRDEQRIPNPRHLKRRAINLARYQRRMARCPPGSANRAKAARAHRKVRTARAGFLHKTSTRLVRDHDLIVLEDLAVKDMVRNRRVARAISDCGWGTFRAMLEYKARAGRRVIVIDRWFPSSKMCRMRLMQAGQQVVVEGRDRLGPLDQGVDLAAPQPVVQRHF